MILAEKLTKLLVFLLFLALFLSCTKDKDPKCVRFKVTYEKIVLSTGEEATKVKKSYECTEYN